MSRDRDVRLYCILTAAFAAIALLTGCGGATTPSGRTPTLPTSTGSGERMALGTNNPVQGDCTTNTSEKATSAGYVVMTLTAGSFEAKIQLQTGNPRTTYAVFLQQVPGSCPQQAANAGTLTTDSSGRGQATTAVPRVAGATVFFVQLVTGGSGPPEYTSDRIATP